VQDKEGQQTVRGPRINRFNKKKDKVAGKKKREEHLLVHDFQKAA